MNVHAARARCSETAMEHQDMVAVFKTNAGPLDVVFCFFAWRIYACERLDPVRHSHWWLMLMFKFLSTDSTDFASRPEAKHEKPQKFWRFVMTCMPWGNFAQSSSSRETRHRPVIFKARSWPPLGHKLCSPSYRYILPCIREPRLSRPVIWRSSACTMQLRPEVPR